MTPPTRTASRDPHRRTNQAPDPPPLVKRWTVAAHDLDALASAAKVTRRTVERWRREGAPFPRKGERVATWLQKLEQWRQSRPLARRKAAKVDGDGRDWEQESKKALALKRMHDLAVQRGEFIQRAEVVDEWTRRVFSVRTRLLALPRTLGSRCANMPPHMIEEAAEQLIRDVLSEFQAEGASTPTTPGIFK